MGHDCINFVIVNNSFNEVYFMACMVSHSIVVILLIKYCKNINFNACIYVTVHEKTKHINALDNKSRYKPR